MAPKSHNLWPRQHRGGFTLTEVLVALALTALLASLLFPLLSHLLRAPQKQNSPSETLASWATLLQADLRQVVSPHKTRLPSVQIIPAKASQPWPVLEVQTFCRPASSVRGPMAVRYTLEAVPEGWALVRLGQGWHDQVQTRQVLLAPLTSWDLQWTPTAGVSAPPSPTTPEPTAVVPEVLTSGRLHVTLHQGERIWQRSFGLYLPPPPTTLPVRPAESVSATGGGA